MSVDLTNDEKSALQEAMEGAEDEDSGQPSDDNQSPNYGDVQPFDLTGSRQVINQTFPSLALVDERTANLMSTDLTHTFHGNFDVRVESSGICKARAFNERLATPGCINHLYFENLGGHGLLALDIELLWALLERLFGGAENPTNTETETPERVRFSSIEERVIRRAVHLFCRAMESAWRPVLPLTVKHLRVETKAANVPIAADGDSLVTTTYVVNIGDVKGHLDFAMPLAMLEVHKDRLSSGAYEEKTVNDDQWSHAFSEAFKQVYVDVVAELGRSSMTLGKLLTLQVGEVIRLDQSPDEAVLITIEGIAKYHGQPTVRHGNLAVKLESIFEVR